MVKINPPDYFMVFVILEVIAHFVFPIKKIISYPYNLTGIILMGLGIYLNLWVWYIFRKTETAIETYNIPKKIITFGMFQFSRNPLYLGMLLILFGEAILLGSIITIIFSALFLILVSIITIPTEERNLEKKFGKKYLDYKNKVERWV